MIRVREKQYPCLVLDDYFQSELITRRMWFSLDKFHHIPVSGAVIYKDDPIYFRRLERVLKANAKKLDCYAYRVLADGRLFLVDRLITDFFDERK